MADSRLSALRFADRPAFLHADGYIPVEETHVWGPLTEFVAASPWIAIAVLLLLALTYLASLVVSLRGSKANERADIIRALAEFWRRR
ncbi:hypothetical protein ACFV3F_09455 [Streptomyces sp. NPDC059717]|uniref:hypothetical protein n=1 Tax=Streptomyces sp. NPDC059717 TaxID=3346922 RepID=UPI003685BFEE